MRRIKHAEVKRLALCKRGRNGLTTLYKSDGTADYASLTKSDIDKGELLAVMWPKGLADVDGDFADTEAALESMTSSLIANGGQLDIEHDGKVLTREQARLTEVFLIQKSDPRFHGWKDYEGGTPDLTGGAAVKIQIDDPALRAAHRAGEFDGVSLFGPAAVEHVDILAASQRVAARMGGIQETEMTKEELQALLDAQRTQMADLVKSAVEGALKEKANETSKAEAEAKAKAEAEAKEKAETQPTFTGDVTDPEALADYEKALRGFELRQAISAGDMSANDIAEMRKSMQESGPSIADLTEAGIKAKAEDSKEVRALQVQLFKAQSGTNVPVRRGSTDEVDELAKSQEAEGMLLGALINQNLGGAPVTGGMRVVNS